MKSGDLVIYRPITGGEFQGECQGTTRAGLVRVQLTRDRTGRLLTTPWFVITHPQRVQRIESETNE
jgi:hypothetical protein